jgi:hypothetical protein
MVLNVNFSQSSEKRTLNSRQTAVYDNLFGKKQRETVKQDSFISRIIVRDRQICKTCSIKVFSGGKLSKSQKMFDNEGKAIHYQHTKDCQQKEMF